MPGGLDVSISHAAFATLETRYFAHQPFLSIELAPAAAVYLVIALSDGSPACGFRLALEGRSDQTYACTHRDATTDERGQCVFAGLPGGTYHIRYLGGHAERWALPVVTVPNLAKGERRTIHAKSVRGSILSGTVSAAETGDPIFHAEVRFQSAAYLPTASTFQAAYTDAEGRFEFRYPIAPGELDVNVTAFKDGLRSRRRYNLLVEDQPRTEANLALSLSAG
jgi:hypothetical protein